MTSDQQQQIIQAARQYIADTKTSQNELATRCGYSGTTLSQVFSGKYAGDATVVLLRLAKEIGYDLKQWNILRTNNLDAIVDLCGDAQRNSRFMAISAATGLGKTTALDYYRKKNANVYYTLCRKSMARKDFLNAILLSMGQNIEGSMHYKVQVIINVLKSNERGLLILDDGSKLADGCLALIQEVYDETKDMAGIILAGTENLSKYINKMAAKDKVGFRELKSRIEYWLPLKGVTKGFIESIAKNFDITEAPAVKYLQSECQNYRDLRVVLTNYSRYIQTNTGESLTQREVLAAIHFGSKDLIAA